MTPRPTIEKISRDERGAVLVESTVSVALFIALTFGIVQVGLMMWSAVGIQYGVQMAARCASVSDAAITAGLNPASNPTPCYSTNTRGAANNAASVKAYAANNSWGIGVPASSFSAAAGSCASSANTVTATNYTINLMSYPVTMTFTPQSCYDTN